jgi:hypothetical protein
MEHILRTNLLQTSKSSLLIDLRQNQGEQLYVVLEQRFNSQRKKQNIFLNPILINDLIAVLQGYADAISLNINLSESENEFFHKPLYEKILAAYLSGVKPQDLEIIYGVPKWYVRQVLSEQGAEILNQQEYTPPKLERTSRNDRKERRSRRKK